VQVPLAVRSPYGRRGPVAKATLRAVPPALTVHKAGDGGDVIVVVGVCELCSVGERPEQAAQRGNDARSGLNDEGARVDGKALQVQQSNRPNTYHRQRS
jgi:hypothetical protein